MKQTESKLQQECVRWFRHQYPNMVLFAIPNGGKRNIATAVRMKAEGVLQGVNDLFLMHPINNRHGLFIEMKIKPNRLTDAQEQFQIKALQLGYDVAVCYTFDQFKETIETYLKAIIK